VTAGGRRRTILAVVLGGLVFVAASYAIGRQIKQSTEQTTSASPPVATITSEAVLVPPRGPALPDLPRAPTDGDSDTTTGDGTTATTGPPPTTTTGPPPTTSTSTTGPPPTTSTTTTGPPPTTTTTGGTTTTTG
jgi:hypothetical protein